MTAILQSETLPYNEFSEDGELCLQLFVSAWGKRRFVMSPFTSLADSS